ncbi:hypothetical protein [Parasphingorhabdus pacifica]
MTPEEMIKRFATNLDDLPPERRARIEAASEQLREKKARGEYATPKPGDNFPIGIDDNFKPFPVRKRPGEQGQEPDDSHGQG